MPHGLDSAGPMRTWRIMEHQARFKTAIRQCLDISSQSNQAFLQILDQCTTPDSRWMVFNRVSHLHATTISITATSRMTSTKPTVVPRRPKDRVATSTCDPCLEIPLGDLTNPESRTRTWAHLRTTWSRHHHSRTGTNNTSAPSPHHSRCRRIRHTTVLLAPLRPSANLMVVSTHHRTGPMDHPVLDATCTQLMSPPVQVRCHPSDSTLSTGIGKDTTQPHPIMDRTTELPRPRPLQLDLYRRRLCIRTCPVINDMSLRQALTIIRGRLNTTSLCKTSLPEHVRIECSPPLD